MSGRGASKRAKGRKVVRADEEAAVAAKGGKGEAQREEQRHEDNDDNDGEDKEEVVVVAPRRSKRDREKKKVEPTEVKKIAVTSPRRSKRQEEVEKAKAVPVESVDPPERYISEAKCWTRSVDLLNDEEKLFLTQVCDLVSGSGQTPTSELWATLSRGGGFHFYGSIGVMFRNPDTVTGAQDIVRMAVQSKSNFSEEFLLTLLLQMCAYFNPASKLDMLIWTLKTIRGVFVPPDIIAAVHVPLWLDSFTQIVSEEAICVEVREYCRQSIILATNPLLASVDLHLWKGSLIEYPFEEILPRNLSSELLGSGIFDFLEVPRIALQVCKWLCLKDEYGGWHMRSSPEALIKREYIQLFRQMIHKLDEEEPRNIPITEALVSGIVQSHLIQRSLSHPDVEVREGIFALVRDILRRPEVSSEMLDRAVRLLVVENRSQIKGSTVELFKILLSHGASTLQRDDAGFLLQTNLRAGVIYADPKNAGTLGMRGYESWFNWRSPHHKSYDIGLKLGFESVDVQLAAIETVVMFGANWTRRNHYLFPADLRQRVFTVLLVNLRLRDSGDTFLTRDVLDVIFRHVANDAFISDEEQLQETKALLRRTYMSIPDLELYEMCREKDQPRLGWGRRRRRQDVQDGDKPFRAYCKRAGVESARREILKKGRDFLLDFLINDELGLLE